MNLKEQYSADVIAQAERELKEEFEREEVERIKAILRGRQARWQRLTRSYSLLKAAVNELIGTNTK